MWTLEDCLSRAVDGHNKNKYLGTEIQTHTQNSLKHLEKKYHLVTSSDQDNWLFLCQGLPDAVQLCTSQRNSTEPSPYLDRLTENPIKAVQAITDSSPPYCPLYPSPGNWKSVRSGAFIAKLTKPSPSPSSPCR